MENTLKLFKGIMQCERLQEPVEVLVFEYQTTQSSKIFATVFFKFSRLIYRLADRFNIASDELASLSTEVLHSAMISYRANQGAKFSSWFSTKLVGKLKNLAKYYTMDKRSLQASSLDSLLENGIDFAYSNEVSLIDILPKDLTNTERTYCNLVVLKYNQTEISRLLKCNVYEIKKMQKRLQLLFDNYGKAVVIEKNENGGKENGKI